MDKFLFKVVDIFAVQERLVLIADVLQCPEFRHGNKIELRKPDGTILTTEGWAEFLSPPKIDRPFCLAISNKFKKTDVPIGTEVWVKTSSAESNHNSAETSYGDFDAEPVREK